MSKGSDSWEASSYFLPIPCLARLSRSGTGWRCIFQQVYRLLHAHSAPAACVGTYTTAVQQKCQCTRKDLPCRRSAPPRCSVGRGCVQRPQNQSKIENADPVCRSSNISDFITLRAFPNAEQHSGAPRLRIQADYFTAAVMCRLGEKRNKSTNVRSSSLSPFSSGS